MKQGWIKYSKNHIWGSKYFLILGLRAFQNYQMSEDVFCIFFGGLECVGHSFAYVAHILILRDVWIRTQRAAVEEKSHTIF